MLLGVQRGVVDDVLGDDDAPVLQRPACDFGVPPADEVGQLDDGDNVVTLSAQLLREPPRVHLVEQQPHRLGPARISC